MGTFTLSPRGNVYLQIKSTCEKWSLKQKHDLTLQSPNQHDRKNKVQFRTYNFLLFTGQPQTLGWTEYCFAPNSAVHESTTVTPAELSLGQNLWGPAEALLQPRDASCYSYSYQTIAKLQDLTTYVNNNLKSSNDRNPTKTKFIENSIFKKKTAQFPSTIKTRNIKWLGQYRVITQVDPTTIT